MKAPGRAAAFRLRLSAVPQCRRGRTPRLSLRLCRAGDSDLGRPGGPAGQSRLPVARGPGPARADGALLSLSRLIASLNRHRDSLAVTAGCQKSQ